MDPVTLAIAKNDAASRYVRHNLPGVVGDGVANDYAAVAAAIAAAPTGATLDLGGKTYLLGTTLSINKQVTIRNGTLTASTFVAFIDAQYVTCRDVTFVRTGSPPASSAATTGAVAVRAANYYSDNCTYSSTGGTALLFNHAAGNWSTIRGGYCNASVAQQDVAGIYISAGVTGNVGITVDGVTIIGGGQPMGIAAFDCTKCTYVNNHVEGMTKLPDATLTTWTNTSGDIWSAADRTDGVAVHGVIRWDGTELFLTTGTQSAPTVGQYGFVGTTIYVNLGVGVNPNSHTMTTSAMSGYGISLYATGSAVVPMSENLLAHNVIREVDGFGIYLQFGGVEDGAVNNKTKGNRLFNVCKKGKQNSSLPFAGIGVNGGQRGTVLIGDSIENSGTASFPAPGFRHQLGSASYFQNSGKVIGMTVSGATTLGCSAGPGVWTYVGCSWNSSLGVGWEASVSTGHTNSTISDYNLIGCEARLNGGHGFNFDFSSVTGTTCRTLISGGNVIGNTGRGMNLQVVRDMRIIGATVRNNGTANQILLGGVCARCYVDGCHISGTGTGIQINSASSTDMILGANHFQSGTTALILSTYVRIAGTVGAGAAYSGTGSPETVVTASVGAMFHRTDGGAGTTLYVKESGTSNTGWIAK